MVGNMKQLFLIRFIIPHFDTTLTEMRLVEASHYEAALEIIKDNYPEAHSFEDLNLI